MTRDFLPAAPLLPLRRARGRRPELPAPRIPRANPRIPHPGATARRVGG